MNDDDMSQRPRRESIMARRLRRARGEDVDDFDDYDDEPEYDEQPAPPDMRPMQGMPYDPYYAYGRMQSGGCTQKILVGLLFVLGLLVAAFLFLPVIRSSLPQFAPNLPAMFTPPTPTIRGSAAVLKQVQQLSRLETTSYTVEKVIEAGIEAGPFQNLLFGDRLLLIAHGTVVAGLDLSTLQEEDITLSEDGTVVTIQLPPVQVFSVHLDNGQTRVYDREKGLLAPTNKDLETLARQAAEAEILRAACEGGIMEQATQGGRQTVQQLFSLLDFERVEIMADPVPPCPSQVVEGG